MQAVMDRPAVSDMIGVRGHGALPGVGAPEIAAEAAVVLPMSDNAQRRGWFVVLAGVNTPVPVMPAPCIGKTGPI
jgi:hypothetical protein